MTGDYLPKRRGIFGGDNPYLYSKEAIIVKAPA